MFVVFSHMSALVFNMLMHTHTHVAVCSQCTRIMECQLLSELYGTRTETSESMYTNNTRKQICMHTHTHSQFSKFLMKWYRVFQFMSTPVLVLPVDY